MGRSGDGKRNILWGWPNYLSWTCLSSTLQMLTNIENRLEELFEQIEVMPPDRVEMAEKVRLVTASLTC